MSRSMLCALLLLAAAAAAGQPHSATQYRIRLTLVGVWGPYNTADCPAKPGKEVLAGTVSGDETALRRSGVVEYTGIVNRTTNVEICDARQTSDGDEYCVTGLTGNSRVELSIRINADRPGAWIQWKPVPGTAKATAGGNCDPELTSGIRTGYATAGDVAEMPSVLGGPLVEGKRYVEADERSSTTLEVLAGQRLRADAGGPYAFERAATITLDGSRSTPSQGHSIQAYEWDLSPLGAPEGCAGIGRPTRMTGATVTFVALCSMTAKLTVRQDDGEEDADETKVTVSARPWKTTLTTAGTIHRQNFSFVANGFVFGYNRCDRSGHFDEEKNHWYEPHPGSSNDYEEGTYWLGQVGDDGPFAGIFYVEKGDFELRRAVWVNKRLSPGGDVFDLNPGAERRVKVCQNAAATCTFGQPVVDRLRRSVEEHEKLHSTLASRALAAQKDPAKDLESSMGRDRASLKSRADGFVSAAVSAITLGSSEENVKAELRKIPEFVPGGCVDFPAWDSAVRGCHYQFNSFVDK